MGVRAHVALPLAWALLLTGCGWFGPSSEPDVAPGPAEVDAPYACPGIGPDRVATPGAKDLPTGAVAARLCVSDEPGAFLPPADDVRKRVDSLVRMVNQQPIIGTAVPGPRERRTTGCSGPSPPAFAIVFRYPDGTRTISGNPLGCTGHALQVGNGMRDNSMRVWRTYLRLLAAQRVQDQPPAQHGSSATCASYAHMVRVSPLFNVRRLTSARLCPVDRDNHHVGQSHDLADHQLRVLRTDLQTRQRRGHHRAGSGCPTWRGHHYYDIVASDEWGDRALLYGKCHLYGEVSAVPGLTTRLVQLRAATARMLQLMMER
jgi:hypothetical protein